MYQKNQVRVHPHTWFFFDTFKNYTNYFLLYIIRLVQVIIALLDTGNRIVLGKSFNACSISQRNLECFFFHVILLPNRL